MCFRVLASALSISTIPVQAKINTPGHSNTTDEHLNQTVQSDVIAGNEFRQASYQIYIS
jgi:hypothetical protein